MAKKLWEFGPTLKKIRESKTNINQAELARRMGIKPSTISQWDRGINPIREDSLARYLDVISITMEAFAKTLTQPIKFQRRIPIPVISVDLANFDNLWHLSEKLYHSPIALEFIEVPEIKDPAAFAFQIKDKEMVDCHYEKGDYLIITPKAKYRSRECGLILVKPKSMIAIREILELGDGYIRLTSTDPIKSKDEKAEDIKIYVIDSVIKKQRKTKERG